MKELSTFDVKKLYIVSIGMAVYKNSSRDTVSFKGNGFDDRIAILDGDVFIDAVNDLRYYSWDQTDFVFKKNHMINYYVSNFKPLQWSEYKTSKSNLRIEEINDLIKKINGYEIETQDNTLSLSKPEVKDPVLKMILKTRELMGNFVISGNQKDIIEKELCDCGNYYIAQLKNIIGENYYPLRLTLLKKIINRLIEIELKFIFLPKKNQDIDNECEKFNKQFRF